MNHKTIPALALSLFCLMGGMVSWAQSLGTLPMLPDVDLTPLVSPPDYEPLIRARQERSVVIPPDKFEKRRTTHKPLFVIHETAMSGRLTQAEVTDPKYKASFHALILRDGTVIHMVSPDKTAYTAGVSQFKGEFDFSDSGRRTVNHFSYQVELESPEDGYWCHEFPGYQPRMSPCLDNGGQAKLHSGYTQPQYEALAELAVRTAIPKARITTHAAVDLTGTRSDPRSFDWNCFWQQYDAIKLRDKTIVLGNE